MSTKLKKIVGSIVLLIIMLIVSIFIKTAGPLIYKDFISPYFGSPTVITVENLKDYFSKEKKDINQYSSNVDVFKNFICDFLLQNDELLDYIVKEINAKLKQAKYEHLTNEQLNSLTRETGFNLMYAYSQSLINKGYTYLSYEEKQEYILLQSQIVLYFDPKVCYVALDNQNALQTELFKQGEVAFLFLNKLPDELFRKYINHIGKMFNAGSFNKYVIQQKPLSQLEQQEMLDIYIQHFANVLEKKDPVAYQEVVNSQLNIASACNILSISMQSILTLEEPYKRYFIDNYFTDFTD